MDTASPLPPELRDRFQVDGELGRGAFGAVFRATDRELGRAVAIKLLLPLAEGEAQVRFDREAALLASLEHPGVVRLYDFGHSSEGPFLVLELLEGRPLAEAADLDLVAVARDLGAALEAIHAAGVIHRDLKPANLLRHAEGRVVLADFGLARAPERETQALTRTGAVVGTPAYLAPEIWAGEHAGPAADWFALGVTLFELRERRHPWGPLLLMEHSRAGDLPPPRFSDGALRPGLRRAIEAMLSPDPRDRPASARELEGLLKDSARTFVRPGSRETARPVGGGRGWLLAGVAAAGLLVGMIGIEPDPERPPVASPSPEASATQAPADPVTTLQRALDAALENLLDNHRNARGEFAFARRDGAPGEHLIEILDECLAPGFPARMQRIHDALIAWLEVAPREDARSHLEAHVLPGLEHISQDRLLLAWFQPIGAAFGSAAADAVHRNPEAAGQLRARFELLAKRRGEWTRRLARWDDRPEILRVISTMSWGMRSEREHAYVQRGLERFEATDSLGDRAVLVAALRRLAPSASEVRGPFSCADRRRLTAALAASASELAAQPEAAAPWVRGVVSSGAAYRHYLDLVTCPGEVTSEDLGRLEAYLELADAAGDAAPAPVAVDLETMVLYDRAASVLLPDLGPRLTKLLEKAAAIALRHDARLRKQPREVGLGSPADRGSGGVLKDLRGFASLIGEKAGPED